MQNERTVNFWDDFYESHASDAAAQPKEWVLHPSEPLLQRISSYLPKNGSQIMEIGCGISSLAKELWKYLNEIQDQSCTDCRHTILATDVSEVCIPQLQKRDADFIDRTNNGLQYRVLNIAEKHPELENTFDIILDKACLDTFLFRSRQRGGGQPYAQLVKNVLNNIQSWLTNKGVYLILSPRRKLKSVRDFVGFQSVERHVLDLTYLSRGELEGDDEDRRIFLYVCSKNSDYSPDRHDAFAIDQRKAAENDTCPACRITFFGFRKGEKLEHRGERFWFREWKGHCVHCRG